MGWGGDDAAVKHFGLTVQGVLRALNFNHTKTANASAGIDAKNASVHILYDSRLND